MTPTRDELITGAEAGLMTLIDSLKVARLKAVGRSCNQEITQALQAVDEYKRELDTIENTLGLENMWPRYFELIEEINTLAGLLRAQRDGTGSRGK